MDRLILFITGIIPNLTWSSVIFFIWDLNKYVDLIKDGEDTILALILRVIVCGWVFPHI